MARLQANIYLTIWTDIDFRQLTTDAQWLYFTMLTHESLNYCGVMDWRPARLAALNADMTIPRIQQAAWELAQKRLVAVDPDTEEALVRSFVRHDGVLKYPNTTKGLVRQYGGIASMMILELVSLEVRRAIKEQPDLKGNPIAEQVAKQFTEPKTNPSDWVPKWFQNTSNKNQTEMGAEKGEPIEMSSPTLTLTTTSSKEESAVEARADVEEVCNYLAAKLKADGGRPTINKTWRTQARLLIDKDKRTVKEIKDVIDWAKSDSFWKSNIMSVESLRKQFDRLRIRAQEDKGNQQQQDPYKHMPLAHEMKVY